MAKQLYLYNTPPRRKYRKGGRAGDDDDVVYAPNQLTTTRHRIPSRYPSDVLPNPGQNIRLTSGESGRMVGWAKDDNQPVMATPNGDYFAFTPQAWLPEVEVKGKRHLPSDGLDKMFVGMMAAPLALYGGAQLAGLGIGASAAWDLPLTAQLAASKAPTTLNALANFAKGTAAFMAGDEYGNMVTRALTPYNSWGEAVSKTTGLPRFIADFTNPIGLSAQSLLNKGAGIIYNTGRGLFGRNSIRGLSSVPARSELTQPNIGSSPVQQITKPSTALSSYQIEHYPGYQIRSLMRGNALEKQLSKNGTINVNSVRAHINKGNSMEKSVVNRVLSSDQFAGKKAIDYNEFRKAVQNELITYDRVPSHAYEDYGVDRLGYDINSYRYDNDFNTNWDEYYKALSEDYPNSTHQQRVEETNRVLGPKRTTVNLNTYTFESPQIPIGSAKHYNENTLGHSRTYTTNTEPDVLHVMESQSDWAQSYGKTPKFNVSENGRTNVVFDENTASWKAVDDGTGVKYDEIKDDPSVMEYLNKNYRGNSQSIQSDYLASNYIQRQIQENLRYAAEHGQTKMRYPTSETARKIEGFTDDVLYSGLTDEGRNMMERVYKNYDDFVKPLKDKRDEALLPIQQRRREKLDVLQKEYSNIVANLEKEFSAVENKAWNDFELEALPSSDFYRLSLTRNPVMLEFDPNYKSWKKYVDDITPTLDKIKPLVDKAKIDYSSKASAIHDEYFTDANPIINQFDIATETMENQRKEAIGQIYKKHGIVDKSYATILKKYDAFPKSYKKLYKDSNVNTVTDNKGNSWYEVNVPKDYLNQEWLYGITPWLIGGGLGGYGMFRNNSNFNSRQIYRKGGLIHIKPENRGKFTATMKRTGKSAEELSHSSNPLTRKRAIFALNARKWHH